MKRILATLAAVSFLLTGSGASWAYEVPRDNSNVNYFYVFGPQGDPLMGAEGDTFELYVDVPASSSDDLVIQVYDPDTSGKKDWRKDPGTNEWDTTTEFSIVGASTLDTKTFTTEYDQAYYQFGPYKKEQGEKVGSNYRFKLVARTTSGDDENLFKVRIQPEHAESFIYKMTFRLLPKPGDQMVFHPEVPASTTNITVHNWDLDAEGGSSVLLEGEQQTQYPINDSLSGQWVKTDVQLRGGNNSRLNYVITKATQPYGNAGLKITDASGNPIPVYFRKGVPVVAAAPKPAPVAPKAPVNKCNTYTFDARKSYDDDSDKIAYRWDFGDGTSSEEAVVTKSYEKAGDYVVILTVTDNSGMVCNTAVTSTPVKVNTPPAAVIAAPDLVCVNDTVSIDGSGTTDDTPGNLKYSWSLGDNTTADGARVSKMYGQGGVYKIRLAVDDSANTACSNDATEKVIRVNTAPTAEAGEDISLCQRSGQDGFSVKLNGSGKDADGDKLTYRWDFGDGSTGEGASATHVYAQPGSYRATLTVEDGSGAACSVAVDSVNINLNRAPVAVAGQPVKSCSGGPVTFDGTGSTEGLNYTWDFGDGSTGTGKVATHTYAKGGNYKATLTVDDGKGTPCSTASASVPVTINSSPTVSVDDAQPTCVGKTVALAASASDPDGDAVKLTWDFGDGTTQTGGTNVTHTYEKGGFYVVTVTADDGKGGSCSVASDTAYVRVNTVPVANAGENQVCCLDELSTFDGTASTDADGNALTYKWNFGDGNTAEGAKVSHTYKQNGAYKVVLVVNDGSNTPCSESTSGFTAKVNVKPVPVIEVK
jgi:PKD repeat protein